MQVIFIIKLKCRYQILFFFTFARRILIFQQSLCWSPSQHYLKVLNILGSHWSGPLEYLISPNQSLKTISQTVLVAMTQSKEKYTLFLNIRTTTDEPRCFVNAHKIMYTGWERECILFLSLSPQKLHPHFCTCLRLSAFETGDAPESSTCLCQCAV